jgi:hypothetical protein
VTAVNVQYTRELHDRFGYSATWVPTSEVRLGDVGVLRKHQYERVRTLADLDIGFERRNASSMGSLDHASSSGVSLTIKAAGELPLANSILAQADAGIAVSFDAEGAILFQAAACMVTSIEDQHALGEQLLQMYDRGDWPEEYVVVTEIVRAERATILISNSRAATIEFKTQANVHLSEYSLVDADVKLQVARSRNIGTQVVAEGELTPLFKAKGVRRRLLRPPDFRTRGAPAPISGTQSRPVFFGDVDYDHFD